jgi:hypothetical protein
LQLNSLNQGAEVKVTTTKNLETNGIRERKIQTLSHFMCTVAMEKAESPMEVLQENAKTM